jgi:predicted AAA+ superfamily ATPase
MSEIVQQAITDQKEEIADYRKTSFIDRVIPSGFIDSGLIKIVSGVRRSGKSTLVHLLLKGQEYAYINFDDERLLNLSSSDLAVVEEYLYNIYGDFNYLFLDEIQNIDGWSLFVNRLARKNLNIFLSGSNSKLLSKEISSHLTGRFVNFELYPFSFREFLAYHHFNVPSDLLSTKQKAQVKKYFDNYLDFGGFPEIAKGENPQKYARALFYSIINRDILLRYNIKHQRIFTDIALFLINNYSREISFNRLKNIFGLGSEHTAKNYVHYLEEAYVIFTLSKFSLKKPESLRYKKSYVIDVSLINALSEDFSQNIGFVYENIVALELMRRKNIENFELYYYKKKFEVDFVIRKNLKIKELIQVSYNIEDPKTYQREVNGLLAASKELDADKLTIISKNYETEEFVNGKKIVFKPLVYWLLGL